MQSSYRRRRLRAAWLGVSAIALFAGGANAEPAPPFAELLRQSRETAPRLAQARAEVTRAQGLARQAGARPNPIVGVEVENFSGSGPFKGSTLAETTASVGQTLELGGKRGARVAAGQAEVEAARRQAAEAELQFAGDLAAAYAQAEANDRRLALATESLALAEDDARIARALVEAGREADLRQVQASAAVQAARAAVEEARAGRATAFGALTALAGAPTPITSIPTSLLAQTERPALVTAPDPLTTPGYLAAQAAREAAARRVRLERARAVPDVSVSVGVRRFQEDDSTAMVAGISAPFPLFDTNRGNIDAARAELTSAEAKLEAARLDAQAEAGAGLARIAATDARLSAAREGERTAAEAYRLTRLGYEGGKLGLAELLVARKSLAEAQTQTIDAALERLSAQAALARLQGRVPFGDQP